MEYIMQIGMCQNVAEDVEQRTKQASQPASKLGNWTIS